MVDSSGGHHIRCNPVNFVSFSASHFEMKEKVKVHPVIITCNHVG